MSQKKELELSESLRNFHLYAGEHAIITAPGTACMASGSSFAAYLPAYRETYLQTLTRQIAGAAADERNHPVVYVCVRRNAVGNKHAGKIIAQMLEPLSAETFPHLISCASVEQSLCATGGTRNYIYDRYISTTYRRLLSKVRVVQWNSEQESKDGGIEAYLRNAVSQAGTISAVIVENLDDIANAQEPPCRCQCCGNPLDTYATYDGTRSRPDHEARFCELAGTLGKIAHENNIACISAVYGMDDAATFNRRTSLGRHQIPYWQYACSERPPADRVYGVTANMLPSYVYNFHGEEGEIIDRFQKLIMQETATKQITTTKIFVDVVQGSRFVCQPAEKNLDKDDDA